MAVLSVSGGLIVVPLGAVAAWYGSFQAIGGLVDFV